MQAPFVVSVEGPEGVPAGSVVDVQVRIHRRTPNEVPLLLTVEAPKGIVILEGLPREEIVDATATEVVRTYSVQVDDPSAVFLVQVTMGGEGFGAVATREHHFTRMAKPSRAVSGPGGTVQPRK